MLTNFLPYFMLSDEFRQFQMNKANLKIFKKFINFSVRFTAVNDKIGSHKGIKAILRFTFKAISV